MRETLRFGPLIRVYKTAKYGADVAAMLPVTLR